MGFAHKIHFLRFDQVEKLLFWQTLVHQLTFEASEPPSMDLFSSRRRDLFSDEGVFEIADLGTFSMRDIYDALRTAKYSSITPESKQGERGEQRENDGSISDCSDSSWTTAEDTGDFYIDIRRRIDNFILSPDQTTMTTELLSRRQRRFVHATAQVMRLGHASLGATGKYRKMIVFKNENMSMGSVDQLLVEQSELASIACLEEDQVGPLQPVPKKRKRVQRLDNGFPCRYPPCTRIFDRASERTKHEQAHQPALTSRHKCAQCPAGFRYPKDLRRHQKVHTSASEQDHSVDLLSSSFGSTQTSYGSIPITSTLSAESRIPSDISLNFRSNPGSKHTSPILVPWGGDPTIQVDMEPLALSPLGTLGDGPLGVLSDDTIRNSMMAHMDETFHMPCDAFSGFGFDDNDGCDDGFLEMARVKK